MTEQLETKVKLLREHLNEIAKEYNYDLTHPDVVKASEELDKALNEYENFKKTNPNKTDNS